MLYSIVRDVEELINIAAPAWYVCCVDSNNAAFIVRCSEFRISDIAVYVNDMNIQFHVNSGISVRSSRSALPNSVHVAITSIEQAYSLRNPSVLTLAVMEYLKEEHSNWLVHVYTHDNNTLSISLHGKLYLNVDTDNMVITHRRMPISLGICKSNITTFTEFNIFVEIKKYLERIEILAHTCSASREATERREDEF